MLCITSLQKRAEKKEANATKKLKTIEESSPPNKKNLPLLKSSPLQPSMSNVLAEMQQKRLVQTPPPAISDFPDDESNEPGEETPSVVQSTISEQKLERERLEKERQLMEQEARVAEEKRLEKERVEREKYEMEQQQLEQQQHLEQQRLERERIELQRHAEQQAREIAAAKIEAEERQRFQKEQQEREMELQRSQAAPASQVSPKDNRTQTRRELMVRRRQARFNKSPQKSPVAATTPPKVQPLAMSPSRADKSKVESTTRSPTAPQSSSNTTARAAARDRYARHKKIMSQQRQSSAAPQKDDDKRRFAC
jgi:hypothetical protein